MSGSLLLQGYPFDEEVPDGWAMAPLGMISESIRPGFASGEHNNEAEGIPHLRPMNISSQGEIDLSDVRYVASDKSSLRIEEGEVLFNNTNSPAWVGKSAVIRGSGEYAFSNHMTRLKVNDHFIDSDFIARQLHYLSTSGYFQIHCKKHVNQASISSGVLEQSVPILIPPLAEQKRIVARIEQLQAHSRRARAALESIPDLLEQLRQSILAAAFRGDLTKKWREQHPDVEPASELLKRIRTERRKRWEASELEKLKARGLTGNQLDAEFTKRRKQYQEPEPMDALDLPDLPEGWCWTSMGDVFKVYVGATPSRKKAEYWGNRHHWVSSGEVAWNRITGTSEKITAEGLANTSTCLHPPGTVLLGMIGEGKTRGQAAILEIEACNNQNSAAIRVSETPIPPEYIYRYLQYQYVQTRGGAMGNNQPALNKSKVESILFPLMPLKEIEAAIETVGALLASSDSVGVSAKEMLSRSSFLDQSILSKAFRGELVPQDPNDEPASVLLDAIRQEKARQTAARKSNGKRKGK